MKKMILSLIMPLTVLMAIDFKMTEKGLFAQTTQSPIQEPIPEQGPSTTTPAPPADESTTIAPDGATVITGLKTGTTVSVAQNNSKVLNAAFANGNKNLIIPSGTWYTDDTVTVYHDTIISFNGKLQQINPTTKYNSYALMNITQGDVTLNNPHLSQGGENRTSKPGTHSTLTIYGTYNTGNITLNGGIIEGGGSNNFQGGRNNTVFNGTTFRDSREHLIYASGINGDGIGSGISDGLIFNDCIFERPGRGHDEYESNHIQIRYYKNVEINNCVVNGVPENGHGQYGILATDIAGLTVNDSTFNGYTAGLLYTANTSDVVYNRVVADGSGSNWALRKIGASSGEAVFNDCEISRPRRIYGVNKFNNSTFKPTTWQAIQVMSGANLSFDNCTWDYSKSTGSKALVQEEASTITFTGTQTKIAPSDGQSFSWGILSTEG